mmetsp:Transcript_24874/g.69996  ORF Transcript_24874/g.69996 Transcript_24874/m.69996 type:complete len:109 (+) Transcript_24874:158-484(+)
MPGNARGAQSQPTMFSKNHTRKRVNGYTDRMVNAVAMVCLRDFKTMAAIIHCDAMMAIVSAVNCHANPLTQTRAMKIAKQKVLFMHAAPMRVDSDVVIELDDFFDAYA